MVTSKNLIEEISKIEGVKVEKQVRYHILGSDGKSLFYVEEKSDDNVGEAHADPDDILHIPFSGESEYSVVREILKKNKIEVVEP